MRSWRGRIGGGGVAALVAVALAAAAIGYRVLDSRENGVAGADAGGAAAETLADPLAELRRRAEADPDNAGAWQELGFALFEAGQFAPAASAYRRATEVDAASAVLWSSLGEALVMASRDDPMPADALAAFRKARELDRQDPRSRYFLAVARDLSGDHTGAIADWLALLGDTPPGAPWESDLRRTIEQVGKIHSIEVEQDIAAALALRPPPAAPALAAIPGPTREQIEAASALRPAEQQEMAEGMVARLAERLQRQPGDPDGWIMLIRSYQSLGRPEQARAALRSAVAANPQERAKFEAAAQALGIS